MQSLELAKNFAIELVDCCVRATSLQSNSLPIRDHRCECTGSFERLSSLSNLSFAIIIAAKTLARDHRRDRIQKLVQPSSQSHWRIRDYHRDQTHSRDSSQLTWSFVIIVTTKLKISCDYHRSRTRMFAIIIAIKTFVRELHHDRTCSFFQTRCSSQLNGAVDCYIASRRVYLIVARRSLRGWFRHSCATNFFHLRECSTRSRSSSRSN